MAAEVKTYDVVVIGSGSGTYIVDAALQHGMRVALVDHGPIGGTCANVGCIPSKMLIYPADAIMAARDAEAVGVKAKIESVDFGWIMERTRQHVGEERDRTAHSLRHAHNLDFYHDTAHFVDAHTLEVPDGRIRGEKIFIVAGARPFVPPLRGLDEVEGLDNESLLELRELPKSLTIIGGGYIACEYAHFFSAMGSDVTIIQRNRHLVPIEEPEVSELLAKKLRERMEVHTGAEAVEVHREAAGHRVVAREVASGRTIEVRGERLLIAAGRVSNADLLQVQNAGIAVDERGYVKANEYLETNVANVWALGDVTGGHMYKHVANREALFAWHNSEHDHRAAMAYHATPRAVFTWPQIAAVGMREEEARRDHDILVGRARYWDVAKGLAMMDKESFAKAIVDRDTFKILGFHIIGPHAPILIQEVIAAMAQGQQFDAVSVGMHIHPALAEVVLRALNAVEPA